jgi:hypothetical protein
MGVQAKNKDKVTAKDDAMDLALLLYEMYKSEKAGGKISNGQNNANDTKNK